MKTLFFSAIMVLLMSFTVSDTKLTDPERLLALTEMTATHDHLMQSLKGLNNEQLNFKSSPDSWSIAECTEHITISEISFFEMIQGTLKMAADPSRRSEVKMTDEQILAMAVDRSNKVKTQKPFEPTGQFGSFEATVREFVNKRKANMNYVAKTEDDLRNHYAEFPFGITDSYQVLLFMSAHTERHVLQIEEVMADPNFPKI